MGAMYEKGQTKRYSRVASFKGGGNKSNAAKGDSTRRRISQLAKEGDIDTATDLLMKMRDAEMRGSSKSAKRDEVRKIRDAVLGGGMPPMPMPPPMNPMVPGMRGMPMMKKGGKVKEPKAMMKGGKAKAYAAGGDLYTTPGGPARGKSGKIKKMAAGGMAGMIPKAGKKSPSSMGTSYSAGGRVKSSAMDGCAVRGKTRGRTM